MGMWFNLWIFLNWHRNILWNGVINYGFWFSVGIIVTAIPSTIKDVKQLFKKIEQKRRNNRKK